MDFFLQLSSLKSFVMTLELHHDGQVRSKSNPLHCQFLAAFSVTLLTHLQEHSKFRQGHIKPQLDFEAIRKCVNMII